MKHIGILVHRGDRFFETGYFLKELAKIWLDEGYRVSILPGTRHRTDCDLAILHVNLTVVPEEYLRFISQFPISVNGSVSDISKRVISSNILTSADSYAGPVIVKTNNNFRGIPEARRTVSKRLFHYLSGLLPLTRYTKTLSHYPLFNSAKQVPRAFFSNRDLVVEKFIPEIEDGYYLLRTWVFFGDKETNSISFSKSPVVKSNNVVRREVDSKVPNELRKIRKQMKFDFGKFDYVIADGHAVLFDANRTPSLGPFVSEEFQQSLQILAEGVESFL